MTLDTLLDLLEHRPTERWSPDVVSARLVGKRGEVAHTFLRLREKNIVTVTYDTEHEVRFVREDATHASSRSRSIRIAQIADADTPRERALPVGNDSGYLWRLNAYWRYEQVDGGVLVELESLTLSRDVPLLLAPIANPIIGRTSRQSVTRTLVSLRDRLKVLAASAAPSR